MGKSAKVREERRQQKIAEREKMAKKAARQEKIRKCRPLIIAGIALVAVVCILLGVFFGVIVKQPWYLRKTVAMETENYKVTGQMMAYYIYSSYETNLQNYGDLGIDSKTSLKRQMLRDGVSWFEFFKLEAQTNMRQVLLFAEKAKEQGVTLTEEETTEFNEYLATLDISAYSAAFGLTLDDLKQALELTNLASKMYEKTVDEMNITDADLEAYFKENEKYFKTVNYKSLSIPYGKGGWYDNAATAKAVADALKQGGSDKFDTYATQMLITIGATEEQAATELKNGTKTGMYYTDGDNFMAWAFEAARKVGDIYTRDTGSAYEVYVLTALPTLAESDLRNVRHILLSEETCSTSEQAEAKANQLLAEWKAGEATEESFAKLADEHSEDDGSNTIGGLYENVSEGEMIEEFNDWLFDDARKEGDTQVVQTDYGYHVMYYAGTGQELWQANAESAIIAKNVDELCAKYIETWPIATHNFNINRLPL